MKIRNNPREKDAFEVTIEHPYANDIIFSLSMEDMKFIQEFMNRRDMSEKVMEKLSESGTACGDESVVYVDRIVARAQSILNMDGKVSDAVNQAISEHPFTTFQKGENV